MKTFEQKIEIVKNDLLSGDYWNKKSVDEMIKKWTDNNKAMISNARISEQFEKHYRSIKQDF